MYLFKELVAHLIVVPKLVEWVIVSVDRNKQKLGVQDFLELTEHFVLLVLRLFSILGTLSDHLFRVL